MKSKLLIVLMHIGLNLFAGDPPATHGMIVVGTEKLYAYHLPMFHSPHDYQAIFEISFDKNTMQTYLDVKEANPNKLFTLVPMPTVLTDLAVKTKIVGAQLFEGHFEQGGQPISRRIQVNFNKVLVLNKLNANTEKHTNYQAILFGNAKELFMAHSISGAPDFDQIVQLNVTLLMNSELKLVSLDSLTNDPIKVPSSFNILSMGELQITKQVYLEFADLQH